MWIEDIAGDLLNLQTGLRIVVKDMSVDERPMWWCAAEIPHNPTPVVLYVGDEQYARRARSYIKDSIGINTGTLVVDAMRFDGDDGTYVDPAEMAARVAGARCGAEPTDAAISVPIVDDAAASSQPQE